VVAVRRFRYPVARGFELRTVLFSHGWIDLAPYSWDASSAEFRAAFDLGGVAVDVSLRQPAVDGLAATVTSARPLRDRQLRSVRALLPHMLRLDEDLAGFWRLCAAEPRLRWVVERQAGRIFRSASVFEDLMKLLFTTNCSWAATRLMTQRLVDALGVAAPSGRRSFPTPAACAAPGEHFYREVVRSGYRAASCLELARRFAVGEVDAVWFTDRSLSLDTLRERLLDLPGFGPYAAGQAMRTLGHYKDLALDSWCRGRLAALAGRQKPPADRTVARRYARFDPFDGLALWMELTADWHGGDDGAASSTAPGS
jgi:N-glycosylase/DNA lyase